MKSCIYSVYILQYMLRKRPYYLIGYKYKKKGGFGKSENEQEILRLNITTGVFLREPRYIIIMFYHLTSVSTGGFPAHQLILIFAWKVFNLDAALSRTPRRSR